MIPIRPWGRFLALVMIIFVFDRTTKLFAERLMAEGQSLPVLPGVFHITLVLNTGSAFGLLKDQRLFFISITMLAIAFIIYYLWKHRTANFALLCAFGLITGGALGNLVDRFKYGYVIDFLDFRIWPVFNIADSAITVGAAILIWLSFGRDLQLKK